LTKLVAVFDKLIIMEDVQVQDLSEEYEVLGLFGPDARNVLSAWSGEILPASPLYSHALLPNGRVIVSDLGYDVIVRREASSQIIGDIVSAGATQIGEEAWNVLRTEAGLPRFGVDVDETTTMPELGQRGISYDKGCYIGQEVVARIKYIGHVNRRFVGFVCDRSEMPEGPLVVRANGKEAGSVTTVVFSPQVGKGIGLGFVNRIAAEPGTSVELVGPAGAMPATVCSLPFLTIRSSD
jgi:folate-binding protein YgfZ